MRGTSNIPIGRIKLLNIISDKEMITQTLIEFVPKDTIINQNLRYIYILDLQIQKEKCIGR